MPTTRAMLSLVPVLVLASCTHSMRVKNLDAYLKETTAPRTLNVVLEDRATSDDGHQLFHFVHEALYTHPSVAALRVLPAGDTSGFTPDVVVRLNPVPRYNGSGWNYWTTFPGFLLFTHAWNGFLYDADVVTKVEMQHPNSPEVATSEIRTRYDLRFCDFDRGAATSSGWYTPGYGGLNLLIGFFMMPYDPDATPEFLKEVHTAYGTFIANSIIEMASSAGTQQASGLGTTAPSAAFNEEAVALDLGCQ